VLRPALFALAAACGLFAVSCGYDESPRPTVDLGLGGGFTGTVDAGSRLVIAAADGRILLDGLAPDVVAPEAPPLVGFATRVATTTYEMQFGAFRPTVTAEGAWSVGSSLETSGGAVTVKGGGETLAVLSFSTPEAGHLVVTVTPPAGAERDPASPERAYQLSWGFACDGADHFAGFGAQSWDADHRGQTVPTFVTEGGIGKSATDEYLGAWMLQGQRHSSHAPIPEFLSSRGYILVAETDRRSTFALCAERETAARIEIDLPATIHVFDGPTPPEAIARATGVFGRPRMPPLVAFAPWLDAVFGSDNVRRVAQKLPSSVIWTEDWRGGDWDGENYALKEEWEVDRTLYPDIEAVADDLHGLGFDFHIYFNPFIYEGSKAWAETADKGWLVKRPDGSTYTFTGAKFTSCGLLDLDNPDAFAWAVGKMQAGIALGADGWMNDFAEWLPTDGVTAAGPSYEAHNRWPVTWQRVARAAIDGVGDGTERLFFARSGWLGTPALADVFWAGDQATSFGVDDGLPSIMPQGIGLGVVGISTFGHDIAGYQSAGIPGSTRELFFRWTALGAWSPVMRTHHGNQPNKEWSWEKDTETIAHFRRYAALHMALVPTLASLAKEASETGMPMWRGLALHHPDDPEVWPITDQVLLGPGLLVAPVMTEGAASRQVYLPAGRWYPWDAGSAMAGPARIDVQAPVTEIPVFAREGTIVVMYPDGVMTLVRGSIEVPDPSSIGDDRIVRVFLGENSTFTEVSGLTYQLESLAKAAEGVITASYTADGAAPVELSPCVPTSPGCFEITGSEVTSRVVGPGTLTVSAGGNPVARVIVVGGAADRALEVRLTY
jgi:alpha-glucosidase (family GH31 glycosyl hydrolase)